MSRSIRLCLSGFGVAAIVCASIIVGSASPLVGSHIQFLNERADQSFDGYVKYSRGRLALVETLQIRDAQFDEIDRQVAARIPSWKARSYVPLQKKFHKVREGKIYTSGNRVVSIEEKTLNGQRYVQVWESRFVNWRENARARISYAGRNFEEPTYLKGPVTPLLPLG